MKYKYYSILYLVVILLYLLRPLLPYIEYMINRDFIVKNLCVEKDNPENTCNGKCYLHEQLNKISEQKNDDRGDKENKSPDKRMDDHLRVFPADLLVFQDESPIAGYYYFPATTRFVSQIFVPPQK